MYRERCYVVTETEDKEERQMVKVENSSGSTYTVCSTDLKTPGPIQDLLEKRLGVPREPPTFDKIIQIVREYILNYDHPTEELLITIDVPKNYRIPKNLAADVKKKLEIKHPYKVTAYKSMHDELHIKIG